VPGTEPGEGAEKVTFAGEAQRQLAAALVRGEDGRVDLLASVGGVRGLLESVLPVTVFSFVWGFSKDLVVSSVAAVAISVVFTIWRLILRQTVLQAVAGLFVVALSAFIAWRTGSASNFFLPSLIKNVGFGGVFAISALAGWPLIGVMLGFLLGEGTAWRQVPARRRAYHLATWIWVGMFAVRLAIQVPLYLADQTVLLGSVNVVLGLPLYALDLLLIWTVLRRVPIVKPEGEPDGDGKAERVLEAERDVESIERSG
jgi:hypothetical protein